MSGMSGMGGWLNWRTLVIGARLFFGLLTLAAVGVQLVVQLKYHAGLLDYFSYFTNLSNIFGGLVLVISAIYLFQGIKPTAHAEAIRGAAVVLLVVVGLGFNLLMRGQDLGIVLPWVNDVTHRIFPLAIALDWLIFPPETALSYRNIVSWLIFPVIYLAWMLARGIATGWYPYTFLSPSALGGYGGFILVCIGGYALIAAISALIIYAGNHLPQHPL